MPLVPPGESGRFVGQVPSISADGRTVGFMGYPYDGLHPRSYSRSIAVDVDAGALEEVSVSTSDDPANDSSGTPEFSADGRFAVFSSSATNLAAGDTNGNPDVFLRDRQTGETAIVSATADGSSGNGYSNNPSISDDGRFIAYLSDATNLAPGANGSPQALLYDRETGDTRIVSRDTRGGVLKAPGVSYMVEISADGRSVAFVTYLGVAAKDTNRAQYTGADVYMRDTRAGRTLWISRGWDGAGDGMSGWNSDQVGGLYVDVSGDARYVAFYSEAEDLVRGDTNRVPDAFLRDVQARRTYRFNIDHDGRQTQEPTEAAVISDDGRWLYSVTQEALTREDTDSERDVYRTRNRFWTRP